MSVTIESLATLGAEIAELGLHLKGLRAKKAEVDLEISEVETKLRPLIAEHAKIIAEVVGGALVPTPAATAVETLPAMTASGTTLGTVAGFQPKVSKDTINKVARFLNTAEEKIGALEIAENLGLPAADVREAMMALMSGRR